MTARPLVLDENVHEVIAKVVEHAEKNRVNIRQLFAIMRDDRLAPGNTPEFVCIIPFGFRCCFSIEEQPIGWCRHLSVSLVDGNGLFPHDQAVVMIALAFGFHGETLDWEMYLEEDRYAVNLVQKMEP